MKPLMIEGRQFKPIKNGTFEHDIWLMSRVRQAGLGSLRISDGETEDSFIDRIAYQAMGSGHIFELLGGTLIPGEIEAIDWTPAIATESAKFFAKLTTDEGKSVLRRQIGAVLFYFFTSGLSSSKTLTKSGPTTQEDEHSANAAALTSVTGAA